jgi:hypothetical protein
MTTNIVKVSLSNAGDATNYEVTNYVVNVSSTRGKSRALDYYEPGSISITFNNYNRIFDPTNDSSTFSPVIHPKAIVSVDYSGTGDIFIGLIDDWSFTYDVSGEAIATIVATEKTSLFANQYFFGQTFPSEYSGERITRILNLPEVAWPTSYGSQVIDTGTQLLAADTVAAGTNVLDYLHKVESSEQGQLFLTDTNSLVFQDNSRSIRKDIGYEIFADDGSTNTSYGSAVASIPYDSVEVTYSSQFLYNQIRATSYDGISYAEANVANSQSAYGLYSLSIDGVLYTNFTKLTNLVSYISSRYGLPEYRFNTLRINFSALSQTDQNRLINNVNLNDYAQVKFKPNNTGTAIEKYVRIIGVAHEINVDSHYITYALESIDIPGLVLDDSEFGKLDYYSLGL